MKRTLFGAALVALAATAASAEVQPEQLTGWWRAEIAHDGETSEIYLHFIEKDGKRGVAFSIPAIGADNSSLGPIKLVGDEVQMPAAGWKLEAVDGGKALKGTLPAALVPVYPLAARFERSAPPPQPRVANGAYPAPKPIVAGQCRLCRVRPTRLRSAQPNRDHRNRRRQGGCIGCAHRRHALVGRCRRSDPCGASCRRQRNLHSVGQSALEARCCHRRDDLVPPRLAPRANRDCRSTIRNRAGTITLRRR